MPSREAARRIIGALLEAALQRAPDVLQGDDVRAVHDMRVGIRRLRSAMATFRECVPERHGRTLRRELRHVGRKLGVVRDADVQLAALRTALHAALPEELLGIAHAIDVLGERRRLALREFARAFADFERARFTRLFEGV